MSKRVTANSGSIHGQESEIHQSDSSTNVNTTGRSDRKSQHQHYADHYIVRTIGWVNFLDDCSQSFHMKLTTIEKVFGVGESTGQSKSKLIRTMLKIRQFDHHWTLPSKMDNNHTMWMLEVNGFIMDVRRCTREVQEAAFEKGLIPYIPVDRSAHGGTE